MRRKVSLLDLRGLSSPLNAAVLFCAVLNIAKANKLQIISLAADATIRNNACDLHGKVISNGSKARSGYLGRSTSPSQARLRVTRNRRSLPCVL